MKDNEELVEETENVEELTTEEIKDVETVETPEETISQEPTETEEERINRLVNEKVDEILPKKLARKEAKMRKEYANKYGRLETVVNAGLHTDNIDEAVNKLTDFYTQRGISIPSEPRYSDRDLEVLAKAEADDIISGGYEDIVEESDRLASIDPTRLNARDKKVLELLKTERGKQEEAKELAAIGISEKELNDSHFREFESKLNPNLTLKEKYEMYQANLPKKEVNTIGSMRGVPESKYKDYYTPEEISKLTEEDLDDPRVWEAVRKSMTGQI